MARVEGRLSLVGIDHTRCGRRARDGGLVARAAHGPRLARLSGAGRIEDRKRAPGVHGQAGMGGGAVDPERVVPPGRGVAGEDRRGDRFPALAGLEGHLAAGGVDRRALTDGRAGERIDVAVAERERGGRGRGGSAAAIRMSVALVPNRAQTGTIPATAPTTAVRAWVAQLTPLIWCFCICRPSRVLSRAPLARPAEQRTGPAPHQRMLTITRAGRVGARSERSSRTGAACC